MVCSMGLRLPSQSSRGPREAKAIPSTRPFLFRARSAAKIVLALSVFPRRI